MLTELNEAQTLLRDAARRALAVYPERLDLGRGDRLPADAAASALSLAAEQGWTVIRAVEADGGLGLGLAEVAIVAHEVGRSLAPGPLLAAVALVPELKRAAGAPWVDDLAGAVSRGERRVSIALDDGRGDADADLIVPDVAGATDILLLAADGSGSRILHLDKGAVAGRQPLDPTAEIGALPRSAFAQASRSATAVSAALETLLLPAHLWIAAELTGVARRVGEIAVAYARERRQFGDPIGSYQAVKHRIVDDYILTENACTIVGAAALAYDGGEPDAGAQIHAARAAATEAALAATAGCIQVHGAAGFSWEHQAHLYFKRARRLASMFGDAQASRAIVARSLIDHGETARG